MKYAIVESGALPAVLLRHDVVLGELQVLPASGAAPWLHPAEATVVPVDSFELGSREYPIHVASWVLTNILQQVKQLRSHMPLGRFERPSTRLEVWLASTTSKGQKADGEG